MKRILIVSLCWMFPLFGYASDEQWGRYAQGYTAPVKSIFTLSAPVVVTAPVITTTPRSEEEAMAIQRRLKLKAPLDVLLRPPPMPPGFSDTRTKK